MSIDTGCVVMPNEQPSVEPYLVECKFTVDITKTVTGDYGEGSVKDGKCVTFEGYATNELYNAIMDAVRKITD